MASDPVSSSDTRGLAIVSLLTGILSFVAPGLEIAVLTGPDIFFCIGPLAAVVAVVSGHIVR